MTWYPEGSGSAPTPGQPRKTTTGTVINEADEPTEQQPGEDENTLTQQTRVHRRQAALADDDQPTIARPGLSGVAARRRAALDEPTVDDDDPTINRPALSVTQPAAELLDHRYQLLGQIGAGGMGEVWRARHVQLARDVAIKFLTNDEGGPRFKLEAQAIAAVRHTGIVDVLDFGETAQGVPYFVMELLEGDTLAARVRKTGPLSWAQVRNIALEVSDALAHTHATGVVHRDLKPSNVIVLDNPPPRGSSVKLIDFGIAKRLDDALPKITKAGYIQGTPAYMSPEQVLAEEVDARSDVYGLGCLLYFLLAGHRPFADKSGTAALRAQVYEQPARFAELVPGLQVPPDVESIVFRAMAKDKTARFASMAEFHQAILAIPPDAGASLSSPVPPIRNKPKPSDSASGSDPLRTTAGYSASYDRLNAADAAATSSGSGSLSPSVSAPSYASMSEPTSEPASEPKSERGKLIAAVLGSLLLIAAAVAGLVWALTS